MTSPGTSSHVLNPGGTFQGSLVAAQQPDEEEAARSSEYQPDYPARVVFPAITYARVDDPFGEATRCERPTAIVDASYSAPPSNALQLAVTMPADAQLGDDLPVVVFVHGGGFDSGTRDEPWFDGAGFAADEIITVSVSYRLGLSGFLPFHDDLPNHYRGIDDCNTALDWVQKNIEDFGGDPTNVTLMGQSAGGGIVLWLARRDHFRGTFRRAWAMSPGLPRVPFAKRKWLLRAIINGPLTRAKLRSLGERKLSEAYKKFDKRTATDLTVGPAPFDPAELADIPLVVTVTGQEFHNHGSAVKLDEAAWSRFIRAPFARHMGGRGYKTDSRRFFGQLLTDSLFTKNVALTAESVPNTWVLRYQGNDAHPAYHCCDIPWVFGSYPLIAYTHWDLLFDPPQALLNECHQRAVSFARGEEPAWPRYGEGRLVLDVPIDGEPARVVADPFAEVRRSFRVTGSARR